jgi:hypothetical protein
MLYSVSCLELSEMYLLPDTEGGKFEGPKLRGEILPGGGDWEIVQSDSTAFLDTRYNLRTHVRKGPKEILDKLGEDTSITADQYS